MEHFIKLEPVGHGTYGKVYKVQDERDGELYALKVCKITDPSDLAGLLTEALILDQADHPNIITCHEIFLRKNKIIMKLELCQMDLYALMKKHPQFGTKNIRAVMHHILSGMVYLHSKGIAHCDLKPSNILYFNGQQPILKITDFNSSQFGKKSIHETPGCTRWYRAPESFLEDKYSPTSDLWSLGCIMYELLTGNVLFPGENEHAQMQMILCRLGLPDRYTACTKYVKTEKVKVRKEPRMFAKEGIDGENLRFLLRLLSINPNDRITAKEAFADPFISEI